ncbi:MAG: AMP-binding protein [Microbacteriaceae bacterium]|nr:AMP-binding protein [Microbacteriaceae bacterium]
MSGATHRFVEIPADDRAWLLTALRSALQGGDAVLPLGPGVAAGKPREIGAEAAVVVRTSGSTGVPKDVALSAAALLANARASHEALGGDGQWLVALPTHLISGLGMLVRSIVAETRPIFAADGSAEAILAAAEQMTHERRYVSLVPVQLQRLLEACERDAAALGTCRGFAAILVGGGAVALEVRQRAHELGLNVVRTYGSTETAGGCVYDGVEIGDTLVRVRDGEVQLAGSNLALGYVGDETGTRARFFVETDRRGVARRWYRTGDSGSLLGGMLQVTGRLDRVFISGGVNVSLDEIERVALADGRVAECVAVALSSVEWGQRAALVVVPQEGAERGVAAAGVGEVSPGVEAAASAGVPGCARPVTDDVSRETFGVAELDAHSQQPVAPAQPAAAACGDLLAALNTALRAACGAAAQLCALRTVAELPRLASGKPDFRAAAALFAGEDIR